MSGNRPSDAAPVVVTGAGGFIGQALVRRLAGAGVPVTAVLRRPLAFAGPVTLRPVAAIDAATDWAPLLDGAGAVVHLASRAHAPVGDGTAFIAGETAAAAALARAASHAGIGRIVLMSSIKALGDRSGERPLRAEDPPAPEDAYGRAKAAMETAMRAAAGPALAVLRPPLVYGPGVKANFRTLIRLVERGVPLPLASAANRRSFVFLDNLLDLVEIALRHPEAAGGTFLLRDDEELSTPELVRRIGRALGRAPRLLPCPPALLRFAARLAGKAALAERLLDSLSVDDSATRARLGWRPRVALDDGLAATVRWHRDAAADSALASPHL